MQSIKLLSFDLGEEYLAFCLIEVFPEQFEANGAKLRDGHMSLEAIAEIAELNSYGIIDIPWKSDDFVAKLASKPKGQICRAIPWKMATVLRAELGRFIEQNGLNPANCAIFIEQQANKNHKISCLEGQLYIYFADYEISCVANRRKNKVCLMPELSHEAIRAQNAKKNPRQIRKLHSQKNFEHYLRNGLGLEYEGPKERKPDIADSFMQIWGEFHHIGPKKARELISKLAR